MDLSEGAVIAGRYQLVELLGAGGMGEVWKARDLRLQVDVAAKRLLLDQHATPEQRRTALAYAVKESRHAAALRAHPNVVAVHDVVEDVEGIPWTVMDLVMGRSAAQAIASDGCFGADQAARIGLHVSAALAAAHALGITHRDVKPANVMLTEDGRVLLVDFGIAKRDTDTRITRTGLAVGTVEYMAPERLEGNDSPAGDLWALGVTLFEIVEGVSPFRRDTMLATIRAIGMEDPPPLALADWLTDPILRLLDKDPHARPTAEQTRALLDRGQGPGVLAAPRSNAVVDLSTGRRPDTAEQDELFTRALSIADTIDDAGRRAEALGNIAVAAPWLIDEILSRLPAENSAGLLLFLAEKTDDAGIARSLIDKAEQFITQIPDSDTRLTAHQVHVTALSRLAGLLATDDPGEARLLMASVETAARKLPPDPRYTFALPAALVAIADLGQRADPHCARCLADLSEQAALGLAEIEDRDWALAHVAEGLALVVPEHVERVIGMITERYKQVSAWKGAIREAVSADCENVADLIDAAEQALVGPAQPHDAVARVRWRGRKTRHNAAVRDGTDDLADIAVAAASADTHRAERLASRITDPGDRAKALTRMAGQTATSSPEQARDWLKKAHELGIHAPRDTQREIMQAVATASAVLWPALAHDAARRLIAVLGDHEDLWTLLHAAESLAAVDSAHTERLIDQAESLTAEPLTDVQRHTAASALVSAAATSAATNLQLAKGLIRRAWQIVRQPPEVEQYVEQVWWPLRTLAEKDPHAAEELLDQLPGRDRDPLLHEILTKLAETDPLRAEQGSQMITDDCRRKQVRISSMLTLAKNARHPASTSPLPEPTKQQSHPPFEQDL